MDNPNQPTDSTTRRMPILNPDQLSPEQRKTLEAIVVGPRGGTMNEQTIHRMLNGGPFNAYLRSPELGDRLQRVGEYIRFKSSLDFRLNEFAILITARHWTSQFEWYAHLPLAIKAGLSPKIAEQLALGQRPTDMRDDETAVYEFCTQLHRQRKVDDAAYSRIVELFGEQGVMDLIGVSGYYTTVSMTLNVAQVRLPDGVAEPLKPLPDR